MFFKTFLWEKWGQSCETLSESAAAPPADLIITGLKQSVVKPCVCREVNALEDASGGYQIQIPCRSRILMQWKLLWFDNSALIGEWWIGLGVINGHISLIFCCLWLCMLCLGDLNKKHPSYLLYFFFRPTLPEQQRHVWRYLPGGGETILCT